MKPNIPLLASLVLAILFISCKKNEVDRTVTVTVRNEYTDIPLIGHKVILQRCFESIGNNRDCSDRDSLLTNAQGFAQFTFLDKAGNTGGVEQFYAPLSEKYYFSEPVIESNGSVSLRVRPLVKCTVLIDYQKTSVYDTIMVYTDRLDNRSRYFNNEKTHFEIDAVPDYLTKLFAKAIYQGVVISSDSLLIEPTFASNRNYNLTLD